MDAAICLRRAILDDADEVAVLVAEAYSPYIVRVGRAPAPMFDDYRQVRGRPFKVFGRDGY
ncbi:hypothetical protein DMX06_14200 [Pseudomonas mosselii]|nr:hypothetical protein DMX06_14200 [Pseudomonas mosselii]